MTKPIRHIVAVRFKDDISGAQIADLMGQLFALRTHLGGITDFQHRPNVSPEEPVVHGFRHIFWFDFDGEAARDTYLNDPKHQAVGKQLVEAADGGIDGIMVLDFVP
ncbi:MAG: Dabb family protein [Pseudomonadota bacterium]